MTPATPHDAKALANAMDHIETVRHMAQARNLAVFLDFDGTLAPIVARPEMAAPTEEMRRTLQTLGETVCAAVISGRDREDVATRISVSSLTYAGSHGFDIQGPNGLRYLAGEEWLPILASANQQLETSLGESDGVQIDRKQFATAVHYRNAPPSSHAMVKETVETIATSFAELRLKCGKMVWELQPAIDWHKGHALEWLLENWPKPAGDWFPLYLGDDVTDEDGFAAVAERGLGILVDPADRPTQANAFLPDVNAVQTYLDALIEIAKSAKAP